MTSRAGARSASILAASEACAATFVQRGSTSLSVNELIDAIGLPARTFHRYFPTKADTVAPLFEWTTATFNSAVAMAAPETPLQSVLTESFARMVGGDLAERTQALFPLVFDNPQMWAVFLRAIHFGEKSLVPILAIRMGLAPDARHPRAAAAVVASCTRISLEAMAYNGADPHEHFVSMLDAFTKPIFAGSNRA